MTSKVVVATTRQRKSVLANRCILTVVALSMLNMYSFSIAVHVFRKTSKALDGLYISF